eukprot:10997138-Ditylum_brightwellii.AAC.1
MVSTKGPTQTNRPKQTTPTGSMVSSGDRWDQPEYLINRENNYLKKSHSNRVKGPLQQPTGTSKTS